MAIARHRTSRQTRWLARQSHRYVAATTVCTSTWTPEPTTTTRAPFLSLSESPDLIGRFWSALPFFKFHGKNLSHFVDDLGWYWKECLVLKVSQIECDSTSLPWQGCLQYYMGIEGFAFCPFLCFAKFFDLLFSSTLNCLHAFVSLFLLLLWPLEPSDKCTRSTTSSRTTICKTNTTTSASDRRTTCAGGADEDWDK